MLDTLRALLCAEKPSSLPPAASRVAQLALRHGGLGLRSAALHAPAAFWASWADAFTVLSVREAPFLQGLAQVLDTRNLPAGTLIRDLLEAGLTCPSMPLCSQPMTLNQRSRCVAGRALLPESLMTLLSLNIAAVLALPSSHCWTHSRAYLQPGFSLYILLFLSSPSTRPFSECYCSAASDFLCGWAPARCRCQRPLDVLGDHVAAWPRSGTLPQRGGPLERAAARVCREAGAAVAANVLARDLNLQAARLLMDFLCWVARTSQLTPPWCPRSRLLGHSAAAMGPLPAQPLQMPAEARNTPTLSSGGRRGAAWWFLASRLANAGMLKLPASSGCWLEHEHALPSLCSVQQPSLPSLGDGDGRGCCRLLQQGSSLPACSLCQSPIPPTVDGEPPLLSDVLADSAESPPLASRLA